jgi:enolase-phosphatase E1
VPRAILVDLEGTTSSISFVKEVLFPYARRALPAFVAERGHEAEARRWLDAVRAETGARDDAAAVAILQRWIDEDRKHTALKALQGMMWRAGYERDEFRAHFYDDAVAGLRAWRAAGHDLCIYSSGSVAAQKLFLRHSSAGDLTPLISDWFDTEIGGKREADSYRRIASTIGRAPADILFLSDSVEELDAARDAGLLTVLLDRRTDYPQPRTGAAIHGHRRAESFADIDVESAAQDR